MRGIATNNGKSDELRTSEITAADPLEQGPAGKKRKKSSAKHVKVDSADGSRDTSNVSGVNVTRQRISGKPALNVDVGASLDPEDEEGPKAEDEEEEEVIKEALSRTPPVHSDYLPLPWKGRLGYVCCSYLGPSAYTMS
jgi:UV DNA damage endonuclease